MEKVHPSIATRHKMSMLITQMSISENTETKIANTFKKIEVDSKKLEAHAAKIIEILKSSKTEKEILDKIEKL